MCRLYFWACKRWAPDGLTLSAYAHKLATKGRPLWRNLIDAVARQWPFRDTDHCRRCHERETSSPTDA